MEPSNKKRRLGNPDCYDYDEDEVGVYQEGEVDAGPMPVEIAKVEEGHNLQSRWYSKRKPINQLEWDHDAPNPMPDHIAPKLQNIVSTINTGCKLNLKIIAEKARNSEYNPRRFSACVMRIKMPVKATALIFRTGKVVVTGTKTVRNCELAARKFVRIIQKCGFGEAEYKDHTVHNIVGSCDFGFRLRNERIAVDTVYHQNMTYEPELFPAVCFRPKVPRKACFLIFATGKVTLTGVKVSRRSFMHTWEWSCHTWVPARSGFIGRVQ